MYNDRTYRNHAAENLEGYVLQEHKHGEEERRQELDPTNMAATANKLAAI
jgi:hypothetical protein